VLFLNALLFFVKAGRFDDAKAVINDLWGASEVEKAIQEFQSVSKNDGSDLNSGWLELLEEPHSRGCIKVVFENKGTLMLSMKNGHYFLFIYTEGEVVRNISMFK
jgi:hypothetical protein